ncbi:MAG TPA: twin-arginine translocation signal domain-containing protein, partial [Chthoniobacteraceae bacterium]
MNVSRRDFLKTASAATLSALAARAPRVFGA